MFARRRCGAADLPANSVAGLLADVDSLARTGHRRSRMATGYSGRHCGSGGDSTCRERAPSRRARAAGRVVRVRRRRTSRECSSDRRLPALSTVGATALGGEACASAWHAGDRRAHWGSSCDRWHGRNAPRRSDSPRLAGESPGMDRRSVHGPRRSRCSQRLSSLRRTQQ